MPFGVIISTFLASLIDDYYVGDIREVEATTIVIKIVSALTIAFGAMIVYQGAKKVQILTTNIGVLTIFIDIVSVYAHGDVLVLGILLVLFGAGLIGINWKMFSIKKALKEQGGGIDE